MIKYKYKDLFVGLVKAAHKRGLHVRIVKDRITKDFVGMNYKAARAFGYHMPTKTIYIDKQLPWSAKYHTLKHELAEIELMEKGKPYWAAHRKALKLERRQT